MSANTMPDLLSILEELDPLILTLARRYTPRSVSHPQTLDLEIDDVVQTTRIKLWQALQRETIIKPEAYVRRIVYTEAVNRLRQHKKMPIFPFDEGDEEELCQEDALFAGGCGMQDPLNILDQRESFIDCVNKSATFIAALPSYQRHALICALKDRSEETFPLLKALMHQKVDVNTLEWPKQKRKRENLRSSLSVARKKLRHHFRKVKKEVRLFRSFCSG